MFSYEDAMAERVDSLVEIGRPCTLGVSRLSSVRTRQFSVGEYTILRKGFMRFG